MRIVLYFDLPQVTRKERREYRIFRKELIKYGFVMNQFSVYSKLCLNSTQQKRTQAFLEKIRPEKGLVEYFCLTEKQYARRQILTGKSSTIYLQSTDRQVII